MSPETSLDELIKLNRHAALLSAADAAPFVGRARGWWLRLGRGHHHAGQEPMAIAKMCNSAVLAAGTGPTLGN